MYKLTQVSISSASEEALWPGITGNDSVSDSVSISSASEEALWPGSLLKIMSVYLVSISSASEEALWRYEDILRFVVAYVSISSASEEALWLSNTRTHRTEQGFPLVLLPKKRCDQKLGAVLADRAKFPLVLLPKKRCDSFYKCQPSPEIVSISSASEEALWLPRILSLPSGHWRFH